MNSERENGVVETVTLRLFNSLSFWGKRMDFWKRQEEFTRCWFFFLVKTACRVLFLKEDHAEMSATVFSPYKIIYFSKGIRIWIIMKSLLTDDVGCYFVSVHPRRKNRIYFEKARREREPIPLPHPP